MAGSYVTPSPRPSFLNVTETGGRVASTLAIFGVALFAAVRVLASRSDASALRTE